MKSWKWTGNDQEEPRESPSQDEKHSHAADHVEGTAQPTHGPIAGHKRPDSGAQQAVRKIKHESVEDNRDEKWRYQPAENMRSAPEDPDSNEDGFQSVR
jgi:hypothetical protein